MGVSVESEDPQQYEAARKAQDDEFREIFRARCIQPKLKPEDLGTFLQPGWDRRESFWESMKDLVTFIIRTANNVRPRSAVAMQRFLDTTAEHVERLPWDETANLTEIFRGLLESHVERVCEAIRQEETAAAIYVN
jgi:hypothetical protein